MFVTVFYGVFNINTGVIEYCNAGHNAPYVVHAGGGVEMVHSDVNLVLGAFEDMKFKSNKMTLAEGDTLVLYTDGVTEAENVDYDQYGEARLEEVLKGMAGKTSDAIVNTINESVKEFAGDAPQSDDITALVIRRK